MDLVALPPDWVHSLFTTGAGRDIGSAAVAGSTCASLSVVRTAIRSPSTGVLELLPRFRMLQPLAAIAAAIRTATRKYFGLVILILLVHGVERGAGIDAEAAGDLDRSGTKA